MRFIDRVGKLIDVKTLITLSLTAAFVFLSVTGRVKEETFLTIYTTVISFFFGIQVQKHNGER
jgi:hypothetical protein